MKSEENQDNYETTFKTISAKELAERPRPELAFLIDEILPTGLYLFAGSPKVGKSFLILHMCYAIASGNDFWGYETTKSRVLYLALEDNEDSISRRIHDLKLDIVGCELLDVAHESPGLHSGIEEHISNYISINSDTKLIVIDTFADIRDTVMGLNSSPYLADKRDMKKLSSLAKQHNISIILVHHSNKAQHENAMNAISGTNGLMGGSDGNWLLERPQPEERKGKITMNNRHSRTYCFDLEFDENELKWNNLGRHVASSDTEEELTTFIDNWLNESWEGTATELVDELKKVDKSFSMNSAVVARTLRRIAPRLKSHEKIEFTFSRSSTTRTIMLARTK